MRLVLNNPNFEGHFLRAWDLYIEKIKNSKVKGTKIPRYVGPGFVATVAVKKNLCAATYKMPDGNYAVCGKPLNKFPSPDSYICDTCYKMRENVKKNEIKTISQTMEVSND